MHRALPTQMINSLFSYREHQLLLLLLHAVNNPILFSLHIHHPHTHIHIHHTYTHHTYTYTTHTHTTHTHMHSSIYSRSLTFTVHINKSEPSNQINFSWMFSSSVHSSTQPTLYHSTLLCAFISNLIIVTTCNGRYVSPQCTVVLHTSLETPALLSLHIECCCFLKLTTTSADFCVMTRLLIALYIPRPSHPSVCRLQYTQPSWVSIATLWPCSRVSLVPMQASTPSFWGFVMHLLLQLSEKSCMGVGCGGLGTCRGLALASRNMIQYDLVASLVPNPLASHAEGMRVWERD